VVRTLHRTPTPFTKQRVRASLGTKHLVAARERRDAFFAHLVAETVAGRTAPRPVASPPDRRFPFNLPPLARFKEFVGRGGLPRDEISSSFRTFILSPTNSSPKPDRRLAATEASESAGVSNCSSRIFRVGLFDGVASVIAADRARRCLHRIGRTRHRRTLRIAFGPARMTAING